MEQRGNLLHFKEVCERGVINVGNTARMCLVMKRALSGKELRIAFLGGSITAGAASTTAESCYAYLVYSWWKEKFPTAKIDYINAGVGATTSKFGVARVKEEVLSQKPDVVFVEFSVNDSNDNCFQETFEGLIRTILLDQTEPAVFMFNNVFYDDGRNAQRVHNEIGVYYELPIVSMKESLFEEIRKGNLKSSEISSDHLHPNDYGHQLVAGVIVHLLEQIYRIAKEETSIRVSGRAAEDKRKDYRIPVVPLTANRYFGSVRKNCNNYEPESLGFVKDETKKEGVWDVFCYGWAAISTGSRIRFEVEGWLISVQYRKYASHPAPVAKAVIDGREEQAVVLDANFEETWGDCLYLQDVFASEEREKHIVEIILEQEVPGKEFYLASIITA